MRKLLLILERSHQIPIQITEIRVLSTQKVCRTSATLTLTAWSFLHTKFHPSHFSSIVQSLLFPLICPSIRLISFFLPFSSFSHSHSIKIIIFKRHRCDSLIKTIQKTLSNIPRYPNENSTPFNLI